ncbi:DHA2 family efflux MFS transporter permease subunit [Longispora albida]|uniref:DHA2 family efflux MFS transporter permease subunit n=1 Tax=Longispora albida TaxID=203523 RepID=UPI00036ED734|nr:DHA2 family efflux MFS transporter permease subunit [Longispora albida]
MDAAVIHRRRWATLGVLCVSLLIIGLDNTVLNVALATLQRELNATAGELQWIVDAYTLAFAGLLLLAGAWGDKYGRRKALVGGLLIFGAASVWAALCTSPEQLIAARTVMGVGAALIMPSTLSILTNSFTEPKERKSAIGIWAGVSGLGIAAGPALGGYLLDHYSWASVFVINIPVVVVGLIGTLLIVPESRDENAPKLDLAGGALSVVGLVALVWAIIEAPGHGWGSAKVVTGFGVAVVVLTAFAVWELRHPNPMLDIRFFGNRRFSVPAVAITLVFFVLMGSAFFLSIYLQTVMGYDAFEAGMRIMPIAAGLVLGAPLAMAIAQRIGEKIPAVFGLVLLGASFVVIAEGTVHSGYGRVLASVLLMGFGMSFAMGPATEAVMGSLPVEKAGVGSAVNDAVRQVGGALGVAVLGSIINSVYRGDMAGAVRGLPPEAAGPAKDNVQGAMRVADSLPVGGGQLRTVAFQAFFEGLQVVSWVSVGLCALGALVALIWLPHHAVPATEQAPADKAGAATGG